MVIVMVQNQPESKQWAVTAQDPVCGKQVNPQKAKGKTRYEGKTFFFCSERCRRQFSQERHRFSPQRESA